MKKIHLSLIGGLGNQLFVYAFACHLIKKYKVHIIFDTSFYSYSKIKIKINQLNVNKLDTKNLYGKRFAFLKFFQVLPEKYRHHFIKFFSINNIKYEKGVDLERFHRNPPNSNFIFEFNDKEINSIDYLYGYFQNKYYLTNVLKELQKKFEPKSLTSKKKVLTIFDMIKDKSCALHIRSMNLVNENFMEMVDTNYYSKALDYFKDKDIKIFYIFTDNIKDATKTLNKINNFKNYKFINIYQLSTIEEFYLLSQFTNIITSISTFSWWAAFLNFQSKSNIIQPSVWFKHYHLPDSLKIDGSIIL